MKKCYFCKNAIITTKKNPKTYKCKLGLSCEGNEEICVRGELEL